jgi:flagellar hook protein FlgE
MSITGSLYSGVSGLKAQSSAIGTISDNISNANTTGYKGTNAQFETLVTNALGRTSYTPGGVLPRPIQGIDRQGLLQASSSSTDVGIAGRGFFLVSNQLSSTGSLSSSATRAFTRAGSFQIDKQGNMVNTAGYYLLGVPTDTKGNPVTSNPALSSVTPVNVGTLTGIASPTKTLSIGANLPAVPGVPSSLKLSGVLDGLATVNDANRYVVTNNKGNSYEVRLQYQKSGTTAQPSYDLRVISVLPIGTAPAVDISKTPIPASLGTIVLNANGSSISGGTGIAFVGGSTFSPAVNVSNLKFGTTGNVVARAGIDSQDITSVVYDSLGVASNLTLQLDRATDLNRTLPSGVTNSLTLSGKLTDVGTAVPAVAYAAAGSATVTTSAAYYLDPKTYTLLNSNGDAYSAQISYANTGFSLAKGTSTWELRIDSLTPIGDAAALSPVPTFPVALGTLDVGQSGSSFNVAVPAAALNFAAVNNTINPSANRPAGTMPFTAATFPAAQLSGLNLSRSGSNTLTVAGTLDTAAAVGTFTPPTATPLSVTVFNSVGYAYTASFVLQKSQEGSNSPDVWDLKMINLVPVTAPAVGAGGPAASPVPSTTNPITVGSFQVFPTPTGAIYSSTGASVSFGSAAAGTLTVPASAITSTNLFIGAVAAAPTLTNGTTAATDVASSGPSSIGVTNTGTVAGPTQNQWLTSISSMTLVATGAPSIVFPLAATGAQRLPIYLDGNANDASKTPTSATLSASLIKFNTDGTLAAGAPTKIPTLPMGTGAADFGGANFTLNLGTANTAGGLTQFTNQFAVSFLSQDGVPFGFRTGVSIDDQGLVRAVFDNGTSVPLYKIPLVNFASVNYLTPLSGNVYQVSNESGDPVANYAGVGGTGKVSPATLEASTVDLSQEFSNLIVAQRSYSANAKTITTADELLQEVLALKR